MHGTRKADLQASRPLTNATLRDHAARVDVPTYDRAALTPAVVHLGVGGFHRSHQAMYFDQLAEAGGSTEWGITGVSLRHRRMKAALAPQDFLFTVVERGAADDTARVVGALGRQLFAPEEGDAVLAALTDERTRLVTLTITGGGYAAPPAGAGDDDARGQLRRAADGRPVGAPGTACDLLVEALAVRRRDGRAPFTVLSCDNLPDNGAAAREAVLACARRRDEVLARWIDQHVAFPSSLVDRITPVTTTADRAMVADVFGVDDRWPVVCEPFTQWLVEDAFCNERPPLDRVGVRFVDDVAPYKLAKTRLLNASHCALGYLGTLAGHRRCDEALGDPVLHDLLSGMMRAEIAPLLPEVPGLDLEQYTRTLLTRLANPRVGDRLARLCARGSIKMPAYLIPSLAEALRRGAPHERLTLALAAWFLSLRGADGDGHEADLEDPLGERLRALARTGGADPRPLLAERALFGDLGQDEAFVGRLTRALRALEQHGCQAAAAACGQSGTGPAGVAA